MSWEGLEGAERDLGVSGGGDVCVCQGAPYQGRGVSIRGFRGQKRGSSHGVLEL